MELWLGLYLEADEVFLPRCGIQILNNISRLKLCDDQELKCRYENFYCENDEFQLAN